MSGGTPEPTRSDRADSRLVARAFKWSWISDTFLDRTLGTQKRDRGVSPNRALLSAYIKLREKLRVI